MLLEFLQTNEKSKDEKIERKKNATGVMYMKEKNEEKDEEEIRMRNKKETKRGKSKDEKNERKETKKLMESCI